jgi:hypothetical protein
MSGRGAEQVITAALRHVDIPEPVQPGADGL